MSETGDSTAEFETLFESARGIPEGGDAMACALGTVGVDGSPSVRMVLLKEYSHRGFVFYTNY